MSQYAIAPELTNDRLLLRAITPQDLPSIIDITLYDAVFAKDEMDAQQMLDKINSDCAKGESIHWGICLREQNQVIGTCGFYRGLADNIGEIGYILKESFRSQGIMTEAVQLVTDFGLNVFTLSQVIAYTTPTNFGSIKVLQKAGFHMVPNQDEYLKFSIATKTLI